MWAVVFERRKGLIGIWRSSGKLLVFKEKGCAEFRIFGLRASVVSGEKLLFADDAAF